MSDSSKSPRGVVVAALGALLALGSLWLPWYTVRISDAFREMLGSLGTGKGGSSAGAGAGPAAGGADGLAGAFAGLFKGLAAVMPEEVTANGWTAMDGGDIAIAVAAGAMILVVLLASNGGSSMRVDRGLAGRLIALGGLVVAAVATYHFVNTPGSGLEQLSGTVDREPGILVAIAGGILMLAGGLMTAAGPRAEAPEQPVVAAGDAAFAPPAEPLAMPEPAIAAGLDPFAAPAPEGGIDALQPFAPPEEGSAPDELPAPPDPFALPAAADPLDAPQAPSYSPLGTSDGEGFHVPDWAGFSEPEPGVEHAPVSDSQPEPQPVGAEPAAARPAGVSIPPPGWSGAGRAGRN